MYEKARAAKAAGQRRARAKARIRSCFDPPMPCALGPVPDTRLSMKIGSLTLEHPVALAPMAGMTDTAFRRLVKRKGGCGLVVTEMVSSEGLVRGIDRTLEYAEYTEEERPVSIQIFGGDPQVMADAAQVVEGMGADIVDINMGCPGAEDREAQRRLQPDARAGARGERRARDGQGGADSGHGQDARRLERAARSTRPSWRGWSRMPAPPRSRCTAARRRSPTPASRTGI